MPVPTNLEEAHFPLAKFETKVQSHSGQGSWQHIPLSGTLSFKFSVRGHCYASGGTVPWYYGRIMLLCRQVQVRRSRDGIVEDHASGRGLAMIRDWSQWPLAA